jgi:hypothetical protein
MSETSIFVITAKNPKAIIKKLTKVFDVTPVEPKVQPTMPFKIPSSNKKMICHLSIKEKNYIDLFLEGKQNIKYLTLWKEMKLNFENVSHSTLGSYLRYLGYAPVTINLNGKNTRVWNRS